MFWDKIAGVYDIYVNIINRKTHQELRKIVSGLIDAEDTVLDRVCRPGGKLIIPTYMNREKKDQDSGFISVADKAGAGFKQQFTAGRYRQFFTDAGYGDVTVTMAEGRIPCAVAVMTKKG